METVANAVQPLLPSSGRFYPLPLDWKFFIFSFFLFRYFTDLCFLLSPIFFVTFHCFIRTEFAPESGKFHFYSFFFFFFFLESVFFNNVTF